MKEMWRVESRDRWDDEGCGTTDWVVIRDVPYALPKSFSSNRPEVIAVFPKKAQAVEMVRSHNFEVETERMRMFSEELGKNGSKM